MRKKLLCLILAISMMTSLCACTVPEYYDASYDAQTDEIPDEESVSADEDYSGGSPWIASVIAENAENHSDVDLKDDFYLATNCDWITNNPIEEGYQRKQFLNSFTDELNVRLKKLMTDSSVSDTPEAELVQTFYSAFLDWDERDATGAAPLGPYLERIENIESAEDLYEYFNDDQLDICDLFPWMNDTNPTDATTKAVYISSPDIFLLDKADYDDLDNMDEYTRMVYDCKEKLVVTVLEKCGYSREEATSIYEGAIEFEKLFSQYCYTLDDFNRVETTDTINKQIFSAQELEKFGNFSIVSDITKREGYPETVQFVLQEKIDYFENFDNIVTDDNIDIIRDYLIAHSASFASAILDKECYYTYIDIANEITSASGYKDETEYAIADVSAMLGWPLSKLYCDEYVTEQDKQNLRAVIDDILDEYKVMIGDEDFLADSTKAAAIKKIDNMMVQCLYPDKWDDYSELKLSGSYFDMNMQIAYFMMKLGAQEFSEPVDRGEFAATPITANAYYDPMTNGINILPGLVGDVLYHEDMPIEEVYAKVGAVIGHEISHAFDPMGANYDEVGNYKCWWTDEDMQTFEGLRQKMVDYYDSIKVYDDVYCDGEQLKGEVCADMAGIAVLLRLAAKQDDFDYDLFFKSYSRLWASNYAPGYVQYMAMYDEHPIPYLRVNVVLAQFDEFYSTYGIKEGDGMYIAPEDRVKIW